MPTLVKYLVNNINRLVKFQGLFVATLVTNSVKKGNIELTQVNSIFKYLEVLNNGTNFLFTS